MIAITEEAEPPDPKTILASLTPEELAAAQRQALLREYGYVEEDDGSAGGDRDGNAPPRGQNAKSAQEKVAADERKAMIEKGFGA